MPRLQNESELYQLIIPKNWKLLSIESMLEAIEVESSAFECRIDTATSNRVDSSRILNVFTSTYSFPSQVSSIHIDFATGRIDTANSNRVYFIAFSRIITGLSNGLSQRISRLDSV